MDKPEGVAGQPDSIDPQIGQTMAKGAVWMVFMRLGVRMIGLLSTVILARLLLPADFGLVALATTLQLALSVMSEFSFQVALIQNRNATREDFDTAWTLSIIRNVVLAIALAAAAAPMAAFFEQPNLEAVIYCLAVATFFEGFENIGVVRFLKDLRYHMDFWFLLSTKVAMFCVTIPCAFIWRDYWALVAGIMAGALCRLVLSYAMESYRPRLDLSKWREILNFSKWLLLTNLVQFAWLRSDTFVLGKILGNQALGFYVVALEISTLATSQLVAPIRRALLPGYAMLAADPKRLGEGFVDALALIILIGLPIAAGIGLVADPLVRVMLGAKWHESIPLLQILAVYGVLNVLTANSSPVYVAVGKPRINAFLYMASLLVLLPLLVWGTQVAGVQGAAWALTASAAVLMVANTITIVRLLRLTAMQIFLAIWRSFAAAGAMSALVIALQQLWPTTSSSFLGQVALLVTSSLVGAVTYIASHLLLWRLSGSPRGAERQILTAVIGAVSKLRHRSQSKA